jgi:Flp pilus assembly protein TadD
VRRRSWTSADPVSGPSPAADRRRRGSPPVSATPRHATAVAALVAIAALAISLAWMGWKAIRDPDISFLGARAGGDWIVYPSPGHPSMRPAVELGALFRRSFSLAGRPRSAELHLRAFRQFQLTVNGQPALRSDDGTSWKRDRRVDVANLLRVGENRVEVLVANRTGPPALWLRLRLPGQTIGSDQRWVVSWAGATWASAVRADAPASCRRFDPDGRMRSPVDALVSRWRTVALLALLSGALVALGAWWMRSRGERARQALSSRWTPWIALLVAATAWAALFINNDRWLSVLAGFDADGHLNYIRYILEHRSLPLADQGWQMYQPPLYYVIAALLLALTGLTVPGPDAASTLRWLGLAYGVANLVLIGAALRLVFPDHPRRQLLGLVVATFLPMSLYLYQLPTNEILAATLSSAVLLVTLQVLRTDPPSLRRHGLLGLCMGLALMAKISALLVVAVMLGVLAARLVGRPLLVLLRGLAGLGLAVGIAVTICGWHYARVWLRFGTPLIGNWDPNAGFRWWLDPGFRTAHDYLHFGRTLSAPLFSGFAGVWDGLYSTLWGDGLCSGEASIWTAPPWCSDLMSAGYLLALVPGLAILVGGVAFLVRWIRHPNLRDATILGLAFVSFMAVIFMTLQVPYYGMVKAFYGPGALLPLCVFAAVGLDLAIARARWSAPLLVILFGTWALASYGAQWLGAGSPRALAFRAERAFWKGADQAGAALLSEAIARDPADWTARRNLAQLMVRQGAARSELKKFFETDRGLGPELVERRVALGQIAATDGDLERAIVEARGAIALNPDVPDGYVLEAVTREARGEAQGAIAAWREALRVDPFNLVAHEALGRLLAQAGAADSAAIHRAFAARLGGQSR